MILVIHGCAGVLWQTPNQMLLYDIVGPSDLESAVRLNAMARYLAVLVGPAVGGAILLAFGPAPGIMLNTVFYLPLVLWLVNAPYGPRFRTGAPPPRRAVRGLGDIVQTVRDIKRAFRHRLDDAARRVPRRSLSAMPIVRRCRGSPTISAMAIPACPTACCWPPMPPAACWPASCLKAAGLLPPRPRTAIMLAMLWCAALAIFSLAKSYPLALGFLFAAGFLELSFNAMAQTLVQLNAPPDQRGRVIGLFNMSSLGLRAFSGISVGLLGSLIGVHWSLRCRLSPRWRSPVRCWGCRSPIRMRTAGCSANFAPPPKPAHETIFRSRRCPI